MHVFSVLQLLARRNALYERSTARRLKLSESYKFQMFERDCDETKIWINEKLKAASDEGYLVRRQLVYKLATCTSKCLYLVQQSY